MATAHPLPEGLDPVLAAVQRAPLVPLTVEEQALLAEVEGAPVRWIPQDELARKLRALRPDDE